MGRVLAADLRNGVSGEGQRIALVPDHGRRVLPDGVAFFAEAVEGEQQQASRRLVVNVKVAVQVDRPREEGPPVLLLDAVFVTARRVRSASSASSGRFSSFASARSA